MELSGPGEAGGVKTLLARLASFGAPVSRAEPGPLQRVLAGMRAQDLNPGKFYFAATRILASSGESLIANILLCRAD